jgi:hypothetical protein
MICKWHSHSVMDSWRIGSFIGLRGLSPGTGYHAVMRTTWSKRYHKTVARTSIRIHLTFTKVRSGRRCL